LKTKFIQEITAEVTKEFTEKKLQKWGAFQPMILAYAICTGMSRNGAKTIGTVIIRVRRLMAVLGYQNLVVSK
jgi:hypothetical protein